MRRPFVILGLLLLAAAAGASSGDAGTDTYPSPLYLSGTASTLLATSNTFVSSVGPGQPATAPTAVAGAAGGLSGSYSYAYTIVDATGGETAASPTSSTVTVASKVITVLGLPTGVTVRLYRAKTGLLERVAELPANASATYTDAMDDATADTNAVILPQAQNRIPLSTTGYQDFSPGAYAPLTGTTAVAGAASTTPNGKGWIADGSGSVSFPTGTWTYAMKLKQNANFGVARLVVGMWKVAVSGGVITSSTLLVDPTCATAPCGSGAPPGENTTSFTTASGTKTISHAVTVSTFSLASNEHLYVQFWRHETTGMIGGSAANELATLYGYDGTTQITHPVANGFPNVPTLGTVAARVNATPTLSATFSDPDVSDTGTLSFQLCTTSDCSTLFPGGTGSASGVANGANGTWTPSTLPDGTYFWRAQALDSAGNQSADWSAISSFKVDTVSPDTPTSLAPASSAQLTALQLSATFSDTDPTDSGTLSFQLCSDSACATVVASGTTGSLANGASGNWTPSVADGTYRWRVRAQDAAGNISEWSSIRTFTLAPAVPTVTGIADGTRTSRIPTFSATFSDPAGGSGSVTFQLCSDAACDHIVVSTTSSTTASGGSASWEPTLQDGTYYVRTRAQDTAGNQSAWSSPSSFTIDTTPPPAPTVATTPTRARSAPLLTAQASSDAVRGVIQVCADPACGVVLAFEATARAGAGIEWQPPSFADGVYYWRAFVADDLGNESSWSKTGSFVVDTVAPDVPSATEPVSDARVSLFQLSGVFESSDAGDSGTIAFQVCTDADCTSVVTTARSANASVGALAHWTALGLADGTYFWRVSAEDAAGNTSAWSDTRQLTLDTTPPAQPNAVRATLSKRTLALRWKLPASGDQVSGYALFINGKRTRTLAAGQLAADIRLRAHDRRTFAVAAIDAAGNVGARSRAVAVMPQLVHLTLKQAKAETDARNLVLHWSKKTTPSTTRVVAQNQVAFSVVDVGSAVRVVVASSDPAHRTKS